MSILKVKRETDGQVFSLQDKVKVTASIVKAWDRNPTHKVKSFMISERGEILACLESKLPVIGSNLHADYYRRGIFHLTDFELK